MNTQDEYIKYQERSSGPGDYILGIPMRTNIAIRDYSHVNRNFNGAPGLFVDAESSLRKLGKPNDKCSNGTQADISLHANGAPEKNICFGDIGKDKNQGFLTSIRENKPCNNISYSFLDKRTEYLHFDIQNPRIIHDNRYIGYISRHDRRKM
jgi:hypothetical protein